MKSRPTKGARSVAVSSMSKIVEIGLNFLLITVVGGIFTFWLSALRDSKSRQEYTLSALRDLIKQVDDLYRSTKQIKRMIRSRLRVIAGGHEIEGAFFVSRMDELSNTQLKLEQVRNAVRTRVDVFDGDRKRRVLKEIEYAEKYLNDVVEEFENRRVCWEGSACRILPSCKMLTDFLGERWMPEEIRQEFAIMEDASTSMERFSAFQSIVAKMRAADSDCLRRKTISDECLLLALREMRDIILERKPGLSHRFLILVRRGRGPDQALAGLVPVSRRPQL
jgi:hypothetical protein